MKKTLLFENNILLTARKKIKFIHMSVLTFSGHVTMDHYKNF